MDEADQPGDNLPLDLLPTSEELEAIAGEDLPGHGATEGEAQGDIGSQMEGESQGDNDSQRGDEGETSDEDGADGGGATYSPEMIEEIRTVLMMRG